MALCVHFDLLALLNCLLMEKIIALSSQYQCVILASIKGEIDFENNMA